MKTVFLPFYLIVASHLVQNTSGDDSTYTSTAYPKAQLSKAHPTAELSTAHQTTDPSTLSQDIRLTSSTPDTASKTSFETTAATTTTPATTTTTIISRTGNVTLGTSTGPTTSRRTTETESFTMTASSTPSIHPVWPIPTTAASTFFCVVLVVAVIWLLRRKRIKGMANRNGRITKKPSTQKHDLPEIVIEAADDKPTVSTDSHSDEIMVQQSNNKETSTKLGDKVEGEEEEEDPYSFDRISNTSDKTLTKSSAYDLVDLKKYNLKLLLRDTDDTLSQTSIMSEAEGVYDNLHTAVQKRRRVDKDSVYAHVNMTGTDLEGDMDTEYSHTERKGVVFPYYKKCPCTIEGYEHVELGITNMETKVGKLCESERNKTRPCSEDIYAKCKNIPETFLAQDKYNTI